MSFMFATCNRQHALEFLRVSYPHRTVRDTPDDAGPLLGFVERDVVRVQDPAFHSPAQVMPGKAWADEHHAAVLAACQMMHDKEADS